MDKRLWWSPMKTHGKRWKAKSGPRWQGSRDARALVEAKGKYVDKNGLRNQLETLKTAWSQLGEKIRRQIIPFGQVRESLKLVGAPYEPEMIGVSRERFRQTVSYIPFMRSRFTNIDVIYRLGWMDEFVDRMFGKGGIWEV